MVKENSPNRIDEILILVSDVQRSLEFYRDSLGIPLKATGYGDNSFEAKVGGLRFLIHPDFDSSLKDVPRGAGIYIHFWVPDVDRYYAQLQRREIIVIEQPKNRPWGRHLALLDPDGYRIEIIGPLKQTKQ